MRTALCIAFALLLSIGCALADPPVVAREQLNALLWLQTAAEYKGATLQAYRQAQRRLSELKQSKGTASVEQEAAGNFANKQPAIVLDIDETVLDNTPYLASLVQAGRSFDLTTWEMWVKAAKAAPIPGAREFIDRARQLGYRVIFITNRNCNAAGAYDQQGRSQDCPQRDATLANLESALGYRPADAELLMRFEVQARDDSDKKARRSEVASSYRLVMLLGDDLNDFIRRADYVDDRHSSSWGRRWFVIPNPMYGSWERAFAELSAKYAGLSAWVAPVQHADSLSVVSWNLEWLSDAAILEAADFWNTCQARGWPNERLRPDLPYCDVYKGKGIVSAADYAAKKLTPLRQGLAALAARNVDIIAVEEVQTPSALAAVLPDGYRVACFTTRVDAQNIGYAIRIASGISATCREIIPLSLENDPEAARPVRRGLELTVSVNGTALSMLNVHLKSGCPKGRMDNAANDACSLLQHQAAPLESWIEEQANAGRAFLILGDWNRDLEAEIGGHFPARVDGSDPTGPIVAANVRNLFPEINDGTPPASAMSIAKVDRSAAAGSACHDVLDQLVISDLFKAMLDPTVLAAGQLPAKLVLGPQGGSDHCALETVIRMKP